MDYESDMTLPRPIKCSDKWIDSRPCCYSISGFAHLPGCERVERCPAIYRAAAPTNRYQDFSYVKDTPVFDTKRHKWVKIDYYWMGGQGWPSVVAIEDYEVRTEEENGRLLLTLAVCGSCENTFPPTGDYLCDECRAKV